MVAEGKLAVAGRRFLFTAAPTKGEEGRILRERLRAPAAVGVREGGGRGRWRSSSSSWQTTPATWRRR
jgi:hypothetical protein